MEGLAYGAGSDSAAWTTGDGDTDLIRLAGNAGAVCEIHEIRIGQITDAGDAKAEMLPISIRRYTTAGSGAIETPTPVSAMPGAPSAKAIVTLVEENIGSSVVGAPYFADAWNIQAGFIWVTTPKLRIIVPAEAGEGIVCRCGVAVGSDVTLAMSILWEEVLVT